MVEAFHHKELAVKGIVGLIEQSGGGRELRVSKKNVPAFFFLFILLMDAFAILLTGKLGDFLGKIA